MVARGLDVLAALVVTWVCASLVSPLSAQEQPSPQKGMAPFTMELRRGATMHSPVDVSFLLDAPAGKHGFVIVKDGHLATADDGKRIRFWGVNITDWSPGSRQVPAKEDAAYLADTLARFGINCVRFQFLDLPAPRGLIAKDATTRALDPAQVDREDYFIAALERRGIYIDFNLLVGRPFAAGDDVKDAAMLHQGAKGTSLYDRRLIELQKEYAKELLGHLNPYTHHKYTEDPAVAIVEINNEDAIDVGFRAPSPFYENELTGMYNAWLAKHRSAEQIAQLREMTDVADGAAVPLLSWRGMVASAPPERFHAEAEFYNDLQRDYFEEMESYLKKTLGSRSLVIATADHSHSNSGYPVLLAEQSMDIIDGHDYWEHPIYYVTKSPMVNDPLHSMVVELSRTAMLGKPYTVSELNEPFPNDYAGEGIPILAAYAGLEDWDGVMWYTFEPKADPKWKPYVGDPFDLSLDPVKMPELAAGALMFLRGDVERARTVSERAYTETQVFDSMLLPESDRPYFTQGFPLQLPLEDEVRISSLNGPATQSYPKTPSPDPIVSDTHQLAWYYPPAGDGLVTLDAARTEALVGFVREQDKGVTHLAAHVENEFCTLELSSLDGQPIAHSGRLLLVAGGTVQNTGERWNSVGTAVTAWGDSPTLIDTVKGTIVLRELEGARSVTLQPLDGAGRPVGAPLHAMKRGKEWQLPLGTIATTWYEVTVTR
ncbi:MAG TPA: hypothetical protein VHY48_07550 [Acidobacteriaceae bacterium]|jgi:hypothetical protein|nr:hypothetical protein [Acidobacteriaceae bacterium]